MKIKENRVICCGDDLGEWEEGKVFFCKKCWKTGFGPKSYGLRVPFEDYIEDEIKGSE